MLSFVYHVLRIRRGIGLPLVICALLAQSAGSAAAQSQPITPLQVYSQGTTTHFAWDAETDKLSAAALATLPQVRFQESVSQISRGSVTASWRSFFLRRWGGCGWVGVENGAQGRQTTQKLGCWVSRQAGGDRRSRRKVKKWRKTVLVGCSSRRVRGLVALGFLSFFD